MSQDKSPNVVPSSIVTTIKPNMVFANRQSSAMLAMKGTLDKCEFEAVGAWIVIASQDAGKWLAFVKPDKGEYDNMIEAGFLMETRVENGWRYKLTLLAIEQIYIRQTEAQIRHLKSAIRWSHGVRFLDRLKKLFTPAPVFS